VPPQTALARDFMRGLIKACSAQEKTSVYDSCGGNLVRTGQ